LKDPLGLFEHPMSDISIAGDAAHPLPDTFHSLLQTISDLMLLLPVGSSLQQVSMTFIFLPYYYFSTHTYL
jgi:E3 ubiquitin-protein ligase MYCBP2